jgi:hypothetical protein
MECDITSFISLKLKERLKTLLKKLHEKLYRIFGNIICGLVGGSPDLYSRDLSFDIRCAYRLTSGSPWFYTVSEDESSSQIPSNSSLSAYLQLETV